MPRHLISDALEWINEIPIVGNFSYHITGLVRRAYDIWEMDNSHITNEELKIKSLIKHIEMVILYLFCLVV